MRAISTTQQLHRTVLNTEIIPKYYDAGNGPEVASVIGRKLPTISAGLMIVSIEYCRKGTYTHMFHASRLTVNEKQQRISGSLEFGSGFFSEQLVRIAF